MKLNLLSSLALLLTVSQVLAQRTVEYVKDVKPILARHCYECHAGKVQKGKVRVDTAAVLLKGGRGGPLVVPGKAKESSLIDAVKGINDVSRMPYKRPPLSDADIATLVRWIEQGAKGPAHEVADDGTGKSHWAFQPPVKHPLPEVKNKHWPRNPIDHFILARLEAEGLTPSPEADRVTLIRRLSFDLLGLPPTPAEVETFVTDNRPDAYERLVDRLLASPHYGERWGRHWLDLARYADTHGFTIDAPREIWKYRDWVIASLNRDLPFDQFVVEQMAGDMLPKATINQKIATGFHRNTLINQEGGIDLEQFRVEAVVDRVNTTGIVFLGLTLGCANCHDHKFDPISQKEYFEIFAFLNNQAEPSLKLATPELVAKKDAIEKAIDDIELEMDPKLKEFLKQIPDGQAKVDVAVILNLRLDQRTEKQRQTLAKFFGPKDKSFKAGFDKIAVLKKDEPRFPTTMVLEEMAKPRQTTIHIKGDFTRKGAPVSPGVPEVLHPLPAIKGRAPNRLDLARWLVDPRNPLIGRVTVNRLWQVYFGKGIVETENDFGTQGSPPTHPELLDWLALEFTGRAGSASDQNAWSLKAMHRLMVTSATYRQSSKVRPELAEADPQNRLLGRQVRLRLDAEIVRDNALAVSGLLSDEIGGPSVHPPQPKGVYQFTQVARTWKTSQGPERYRRGLYTFLQRSAPYPALIVFDAPDGTSSCTRRIRSNTPLQALTLLNDQAFLELARGLANRVIEEGPNNDAGKIGYAFRLCVARSPSPRESHKLEVFLNSQRTAFRAAPKEALALLTASAADARKANVPQAGELASWTALARVLLNLDEFITRE